MENFADLAFNKKNILVIMQTNLYTPKVQHIVVKYKTSSSMRVVLFNIRFVLTMIQI